MDQKPIKDLWKGVMDGLKSKKLNTAEYDYLMQIKWSIEGLAMLNNLQFKEYEIVGNIETQKET